jgi:hypothetical protein
MQDPTKKLVTIYNHKLTSVNQNFPTGVVCMTCVVHELDQFILE